MSQVLKKVATYAKCGPYLGSGTKIFKEDECVFLDTHLLTRDDSGLYDGYGRLVSSADRNGECQAIEPSIDFAC